MSSTSDSQIMYMAHVYIMPIFLTVGFVGQLLNLFTLSQPSLRGVSYHYLKAIAVADLLSIVALIPFVMRYANLHLKHNYWAVNYHAHLEVPLINAFLGASTLCIVGLTLERFMSICYPVASHRASTATKRTTIIICCLYGLSFAIFIPSFYQKEVHVVMFNDSENLTEYNIVRNQKLHDLIAFKIYLMVRELVVRLGPILILIILNIGISVLFRKIALKHRRLKNRHYSPVSNRIGQPRERQRDLYDEERRIYILIVITVITFIICTLPAAILSLLVADKRYKRTKTFQIFRAGANLLEVTSYVANFYIYCLCSREYRTAFLSMLRRDGRRRPSDRMLITMTATPSEYRRRSRTPISINILSKNTENNNPISENREMIQIQQIGEPSVQGNNDKIVKTQL